MGCLANLTRALADFANWAIKLDVLPIFASDDQFNSDAGTVPIAGKAPPLDADNINSYLARCTRSVFPSMHWNRRVERISHKLPLDPSRFGVVAIPNDYTPNSMGVIGMIHAKLVQNDRPAVPIHDANDGDLRNPNMADRVDGGQRVAEQKIGLFLLLRQLVPLFSNLRSHGAEGDGRRSYGEAAGDERLIIIDPWLFGQMKKGRTEDKANSQKRNDEKSCVRFFHSKSPLPINSWGARFGNGGVH